MHVPPRRRQRSGGAVEPSPWRWVLLSRRSEPNAARGCEDTMRYCDAPMMPPPRRGRLGTARRGRQANGLHRSTHVPPPPPRRASERVWPRLFYPLGLINALAGGRARRRGAIRADRPRRIGIIDRSQPAVHRIRVAGARLYVACSTPRAWLRRGGACTVCVWARRGVLASWSATRFVHRPAAGGPAYVHSSVLYDTVPCTALACRRCGVLFPVPVPCTTTVLARALACVR